MQAFFADELQDRIDRLSVGQRDLPAVSHRAKVVAHFPELVFGEFAALFHAKNEDTALRGELLHRSFANQLAFLHDGDAIAHHFHFAQQV